MTHAVAYLPWVELSDRERCVWCAAFASGGADPATAAQAADACVRRLRTLSLDGPQALEPEYEMARVGYHWEFEEFAPWYRVAWRLRHGHALSYHVPTLDEIREAYDRFLACRSDFS